MSARKLAALVIKLVFLYLTATNLFSALAGFVVLPFAEKQYVHFGYIELGLASFCTVVYFGPLVYADRLARWIIREDWTIASELADGSVFWSKTVPVLMVMGTGILVIGTGASNVASQIVHCVVVTESETFLYPIGYFVKELLGPLLSLAVGVYLFLRPGALLKLFQRYGKAE